MFINVIDFELKKSAQFIYRPKIEPKNRTKNRIIESW